MKISILGSGNVGSALSSRLTAIGHEVVTADTSTGPERTAAQAAQADLVILAVPFAAVETLDPRVGASLAGKVVVDATNPLAPDFMSLTVGHTASGGERVAAALPGARVVKAFNTVFAGHLGEDGAGRFLPVAGDDEAAKKTVLDLGAQLGFDAVDAGPLANARYTEPAVELLIQLAYGRGMGDGIAFTLTRA
ncbi:NADPH-dependent F420 reductase [Planomonospora sp. ID91781]|uniref:NADP oxidoreductase n=3 Tax=Planomonospora TaxID=1998 RepID=A0A171BAR0_9ACTN|nr:MULTISPECIES: NADPH-dependent F420 reductase [Planomonospora]MBG0822023.1 NADPH-dependent F420 reductase [Planomonospora sp. ID91781]GAT64852.1 NADP oxidoreductase [Planomonospora sphaerica]